LRKKKDLIKKFIEENLPKIDKSGDVEKAFSEFWENERSRVLRELAETEGIPIDKMRGLIGDYIYSQKTPRDQEIADLLPQQPRILELRSVVNKIKGAIKDIVDIFEW